MEYTGKRSWAAVMVALVLAAAALLCVAKAAHAGHVFVQPGQDLDALVNSDPAGVGTTFRLHPDTYVVDHTLQPKNGDMIIGVVGSYVTRGPAQDPQNITAQIVGRGLSQVVKPQGKVNLHGLSISGGQFDGTAGSGSGLAGGAMTPQSSVDGVRLHHNDGLGASNANGVYTRVELDHNGTAADAQGFIASGIKGVNEFVIANSYIHDNGGNGIWADEYANDTNVTYNGITGKAQFVDNLVVNSSKQGIRWEKINSSGPASQPTAGEALILRNEVHGNNPGRATGGIGVRDAANAQIHNNVLGAATIAGISYPQNGGGVGIWVTDSGRVDRPNTEFIEATNNVMNGEVYKCAPYETVTCR